MTIAFSSLGHSHSFYGEVGVKENAGTNRLEVLGSFDVLIEGDLEGFLLLAVRRVFDCSLLGPDRTGKIS